VKLPLLEEDLAACVSCGLCLPHCPTFRVTGEERYSPRGRIEAIRQIHHDQQPADASFVDMMDTCVQCRGCETACPSGVHFGRLMEAARSGLAQQSRYQPWYRRLGYRALGHHRLVVAGSRALAALQRLRLVPSRRLGLPDRLPLRAPALRSRPAAPGAPVVWLHTGCVMDAWQRDVHDAALRVLGAMGVDVRLPEVGWRGGCCGALAVHAGLTDIARAQAEATMATFAGGGDGAGEGTAADAPVLVDSAGCGAQLKDVGHLLGTDAAHRFARRVFDIQEWIAEHLDRLPAPDPAAAAGAGRPTVAVQDPCHLRHVQRVHGTVRAVLRPYAALVELDDEGLCCGAGGAYSVLQPELAADIRRRKLAAIERSGATVVVSANPGCSLHLQAAGVTVRHPMELLAAAVAGAAPTPPGVPPVPPVAAEPDRG
jgi:glycolate oxidase iron-sulfur subunit